MGKSCIIRLGITVAVFCVSSIMGGLVILLVMWLYPSINPPLFDLLQSNKFPYPADTLWVVWTAVPCCFNMAFAAALSLGINMILNRTKQAGRGE